MTNPSFAQTPGAAARLGFDPARLARIDRHFTRYLEAGKIPGWQVAITRRGELAYLGSGGHRDIESRLPVTNETLWRIYSMTKPIASVAAMTFWEEGAFQLNDPISRWLPAFADARVYVKGSISDAVSVPVKEPIRVWHLLTHTSGITAGWMSTSVVDALYRDAGYGTFPPAGTTVESFADAMAALPLLFEPGTAWGYGNSTDVLGRLIELWSGQPLDAAIAERVTVPLGMTDTVWHAHAEHQLATLYRAGDDGGVTPLDEISGYAKVAPSFFAAGGGMLSTLPDYVRFTQMLLGNGTLGGVRIISPRTLRLMTQSHLSADLATLLTGGFADAVFDGVGFGLGFAVVVDPLKAHSVSSPGEYYWGGAASTVFWVDPAQELAVVFMTQLMAYQDGQLVPREALPLRGELRQLVYGSLIG
jgi:CubicO group peptidase (beta-lactamase class C family)